MAIESGPWQHVKLAGGKVVHRMRIVTYSGQHALPGVPDSDQWFACGASGGRREGLKIVKGPVTCRRCVIWPKGLGVRKKSKVP